MSEIRRCHDGEGRTYDNPIGPYVRYTDVLALQADHAAALTALRAERDGFIEHLRHYCGADFAEGPPPGHEKSWITFAINHLGNGSKSFLEAATALAAAQTELATEKHERAIAEAQRDANGNQAQKCVEIIERLGEGKAERERLVALYRAERAKHRPKSEWFMDRSKPGWPMKEGPPVEYDAATDAATEAKQPAASKSLERTVKQLVASNAVHVRKGTVLGKELWKDVVEHLGEEVREFSDAVYVGSESNSKEELADILGIVVHAAIKLGVSMTELEAMEIEKLSRRFTTPDASKAGGQ